MLAVLLFTLYSYLQQLLWQKVKKKHNKGDSIIHHKYEELLATSRDS